MSDDLTLEKLEISKRLSSVEITIAKLETSHDHVKCKVDEIHSALVGNNGSCGLIKSVDRLDQTVRGWKDSVKLVWVSIIGLVLKSFWGLFDK